MNLFQLLRPLLFRLDPETAHHVTLKTLKLAHRLHLIKKPYVAANPHQIMGLSFPNLVGLAAGLDKNGDYIDALAVLGFGFIEIGTLTPKPQFGNRKPRLFRLVPEQAIINRMGFNNKGVDYAVAQLKKIRYRGILGINIGKNRDTPIEQAVDDYVFAFRRLAPFASYITVNISSPNTPSLRELQHGNLLRALLQTLKKEQTILAKYVPLVVKIAPDLTHEELKNLTEILLTEKIDGIIATNTTTSRTGVETSAFASESGGLSGRPLTTPSTQLVQQLHQLVQKDIPIIACGGILSADDGAEKIAAGASLLQVYTGLIYRGPELVKELIKVY